MHINIAWQDVDTVLLDMDGTLLDLAFDNYFWQKLVPETWGAKNGVTPQEAMEYMRQQYHDVQHTLNWYCLDYWSEQLGLDICAMTTEMGPRAVLREDTIPFLEALKASGKQRISPCTRATPRICWLLLPLITARFIGPSPCSCTVISPSNFSVAVNRLVATSSSASTFLTGCG